MIHFKRRFATSSLICMAFLIPNAYANIITVSNQSFETLSVGGLSVSCTGTGCAFSSALIPGWTNAGTSGQFQPGNPANTNYFNTLDPDSTPTSAYVNSGTISQLVGATVQVGITYTLLVDIGIRKEPGGLAGSAAILVNGTQYLATGSAFVGGFATFMATYTGLPGDAGAPITIQLISPGQQQGNFDNVRMTDSVTTDDAPEPAFTTLLGASLVAVVGFARRRKRSS